MAESITPSHSQERLGEPKIELPPSKIQRLLAYRLLWLLAASILVLDRFTKVWIATKISFGTYGEENGAITVVSHFFYLVHVGNTGAAWSILTGKSVLLAALATATLAAIYFWRRALGLHHRMAQVCFGLLCGGIAGNLVDRIHYGYVVDFIDLHFGSYVYPTFNVADSGICIGVLLYLWHSLRAPKV